MSLRVTGAAGSRFRMQSALVDTGSFTHTFHVKRMAVLSGLKTLFNLSRGVGNYHDIIVNDPGEGTAHLPTVQANWASSQAKGNEPLPFDAWFPIAVVGSGANISLKWRNAGVVMSVTVAQTPYQSENEWWGDAGSDTNLFIGLYAHIHRYDIALSDSDILSDWNTGAPVRALGAGLLSRHSGAGGTVAAAVAGQAGPAFVAGSALAYSDDMPVISNFTGVTITGEAVMPSVTAANAAVRVNRVLHSSGTGLAQAPWEMQGHELIAGAAALATSTQWGAVQRVRTTNVNGGIIQRISNMPGGRHLAYMVVSKVDTDLVVFRHTNDTLTAGGQGHFNLATGAWGYTGNFGTANDADFGSRLVTLGNYYLIWISVTLPAGGRAIEFYPLVTNGVQQIPLGKSLDISTFQMEDGIFPTYPKLTTTAMVSRTLASIAMALSPSAVPVAGLASLGVSLLDSVGAPWDSYGPLNFFNPSPAIAEYITPLPTGVDFNGSAYGQVRGLANGTASLTVSTYRVPNQINDPITSQPVVLTIGGAQSGLRVEILAEAGWSGKGGFAVGVYTKHSTERYPTAKLFEVSQQVFQTAPTSAGLSRMLISPPSGVTLTAGQQLEAVIENDNYLGTVVAGPGIFTVAVV